MKPIIAIRPFQVSAKFTKPKRVFELSVMFKGRDRKPQAGEAFRCNQPATAEML